MGKIALITGVGGQDGSFLSELLLDKNYVVYGIKRRTSTNTLQRIEHLRDDKNFHVIEGDVTDSGSIFQIFSNYKPDECYHLAAQSHVGTSFEQPFYTSQVNYIGTLTCLEAIRLCSHHTRFYCASTSEQFGSNYKVDQDGMKYQDETTTMTSRSPYGTSKIAAYLSVKNYREAYNMFCCSGILYNHESSRRGEEFVTRKITFYISQLCRWMNENFSFFNDLVFDKETIKTKTTDASFPKLRLGNVDTFRDWGFAGDYVKAMWMMLNAREPVDYVVSTGETHSVREFLEYAFNCIGVSNYEDFFVVDQKFFRASDVEYLRGDSIKIRTALGWEPKMTFKEIVREMVEADLYEIQKTAEVLQET